LTSMWLGRERQWRRREAHWLGSAGDRGPLPLSCGTAMRAGLGRGNRARLEGGARALMSGKLTRWSGRSGRCQPGWGTPENPRPGHARTVARRGFAVSLAVAAAVSVSAVSIGGTAAATQAITPS